MGFEYAGYAHVASYDIIPVCGETLSANRPHWKVYAGESMGDVKKLKTNAYQGKADVIHGGPPCQPFSIAGQQEGENDHRNMWGSFIRVVNEVRPKAFIAENVKGILDKKFSDFVSQKILDPLSEYHIQSFTLNSAGFGVPQKRERVFFVGFRSKTLASKFMIPEYTHSFDHLITKNGYSPCGSQPSFFGGNQHRCMGVREALGLPDTGKDALCPTIRSAFTGKRNTTSILNSTAAAKNLEEIEIWGSGVAADRDAASRYPTRNGHFRLSVQDCAILQGFPSAWKFEGAVYKVLGQIGNSVSPPVAYSVARNVAIALQG